MIVIMTIMVMIMTMMILGIIVWAKHLLFVDL